MRLDHLYRMNRYVSRYVYDVSVYDVYMNEEIDWNERKNDDFETVDVFVSPVAPIDITSGGHSGVPVATKNSLENQAWSFHFCIEPVNISILYLACIRHFGA